MSKKIYSLSILLFAIVFVCNAQSIPRFVIASSGAQSTAGNIQLSWTLGQPSPVENIAPQYFYITQGYQQGDEDFVSVEKPQVIDNNIVCFPNPASNFTTLKGSVPYDGDCNIIVVDINGKVIYKTIINIDSNKKFETNINVENFASGTYVIQLQSISKNNPFIANKKLTVIK